MGCCTIYKRVRKVKMLYHLLLVFNFGPMALVAKLQIMDSSIDNDADYIIETDSGYNKCHICWRVDGSHIW